MRRLLSLLCIGLLVWPALPAWAITPAADRPMGEEEARQLLTRSGFSASLREVRDFSVLSRERAVDRLLAGTRTTARTAPPAWVEEGFSPRALRTMRQSANEAEKRLLLRDLRLKSLDLRAWWLQEMIETDSPLTERMTLFWHNHFVSSQQKVKSPLPMYRQNLLLRRHATGSFGTLLHAVARNPAMILYLDSASNRKGQPNENFARELMELFTLGEGHYSEQDIRDAARAFTGWSLDRDTGEYRFYRALHDGGEKTVLGRRGRLNGDDVLDQLLAQPATAGFITRKLWREFISPQPDEAEVQRIAAVFRASGYDIKTVLRALLVSDHFYAPANRAVLVKSPVDLLVGSLRQFDMAPGDLRSVALASRTLGQDLFAPPNVKGWPGGEAWINSATLLARQQVLARLFRAGEMPVGMDRGTSAAGLRRQLLAGPQAQFDAGRWAQAFAGDDTARRAQIARLLLATPPPELPPAADVSGFISQLVLDPRYQLK